jgi:hypothetical protein
VFRVWELVYTARRLKRMRWKQWMQALLDAYDTLSQLILQNSTHSELLFYRALFVWTRLPLMDDNFVSFNLRSCLSDLVEIYREMLPKQRGRRPPSSFRMAKKLNWHAAARSLRQLRERLSNEGFFEHDADCCCIPSCEGAIWV